MSHMYEYFSFVLYVENLALLNPLPYQMYAGTRLEKPVRKTKLDPVHYLFPRPPLVYLHVNQGFIRTLRRFAVTIQCASKCNHSSFGGFCTCHSFDTRHRAVRLHTSCARVRHDIDVFYFNSFCWRAPTHQLSW